MRIESDYCTSTVFAVEHMLDGQCGFVKAPRVVSRFDDGDFIARIGGHIVNLTRWTIIDKPAWRSGDVRLLAPGEKVTLTNV
jgi:hypothetical protein